MRKFPLMASEQNFVQNVFAKIVVSACFVKSFPKNYTILKFNDWKKVW